MTKCRERGTEGVALGGRQTCTWSKSLNESRNVLASFPRPPPVYSCGLT